MFTEVAFSFIEGVLGIGEDSVGALDEVIGLGAEGVSGFGGVCEGVLGAFDVFDEGVEGDFVGEREGELGVFVEGFGVVVGGVGITFALDEFTGAEGDDRGLGLGAGPLELALDSVAGEGVLAEGFVEGFFGDRGEVDGGVDGVGAVFELEDIVLEEAAECVTCLVL